MHVTPDSCCEPFVRDHGQPIEFVRTLYTKPADDYLSYLDEVDKLNDELQRLETCPHYRKEALREHTYLEDGEHDNRIYYGDMKAAQYCAQDPRDLPALREGKL